MQRDYTVTLPKSVPVLTEQKTKENNHKQEKNFSG